MMETILGLVLTVTVVAGTPAMTFAAEDTATEQEAAGTVEDFQAGDVTVKNTTTVNVKTAEITEAVKKAEEPKADEADAKETDARKNQQSCAYYGRRNRTYF